MLFVSKHIISGRARKLLYPQKPSDPLFALLLEGPARPRFDELYAETPTLPETGAPPSPRSAQSFTAYRVEFRDKEQLLALNDLRVKLGEGIMVELDGLKRLPGFSFHGNSCFSGPLDQDAELKLAPVSKPFSTHYMTVNFEGMTPSREGELMVRATEQRANGTCRLALSVPENLAEVFRLINLRRGEPILLGISNLFLTRAYNPAENALGGTVFDVFEIGPKRGLRLTNKLSPKPWPLTESLH
ncbi:MAG: hypothetical protein LBO66_08345 [Deltaproteobacteria bacterium]|jgi:hypothetical protein|nr:hypothetical protein [Deltaproteobacteria bacterium]